MDIGETLTAVTKEMDDAEDALIASGFPLEQWMLVRKFVLSAILRHQIVLAKAMENLPLEGDNPIP